MVVVAVVVWSRDRIDAQSRVRLDDDLAELEVDVLAGELLVDGGEGLDLVLDVGLLRLVQVDLDELGAVEFDARALANNLGRVDEIVERRLVHGRERAADRSLLLVARAGLARRLRQYFPLHKQKNKHKIQLIIFCFSLLLFDT